jgi:hypothetical protein
LCFWCFSNSFTFFFEYKAENGGQDKGKNPSLFTYRAIEPLGNGAGEERRKKEKKSKKSKILTLTFLVLLSIC